MGKQHWEIQNGWLNAAQRIDSPNCDARPAGADIDLLVIHGISLPPGEFGGDYISDLFCNCLDPGQHPYFAEISHLRVSAHLLIRRDGELLQYVPFSARAWHAGASSFEGRTACNDFAIGIELEGVDDLAYTSAQYQKLAAIARVLMRYYPGITPNRIVGHSSIAPERKTDPGPAFDWKKLQRMLSK